MHFLIPFAFCSSEACAQALYLLKLPQLEKLLRQLTAEPLDVGTELSLSPPHERALARALNLPTEDGLIPWAARQAQMTGLAPQAASDWAFVTPCHWHAGAKQVAMSAAQLPDFTALESQALLAAMQPYLEEDGITLYYEQPTRWLACGDAFKGLASASLDRVAGRNVANWLPSTSKAIALQRLQSEMQMLLYRHPVNEAREARGVPAANSFWISGTGALPQLPASLAVDAQPVVLNTLREAALSEDWAAWVAAWQAIDAAACHTLLDAHAHGESVQLTLCGERNAQTFHAAAPRYLKRFINIFSTRPASAVLEQL